MHWWFTLAPHFFTTENNARGNILLVKVEIFSDQVYSSVSEQKYAFLYLNTFSHPFPHIPHKL